MPRQWRLSRDPRLPDARADGPPVTLKAALRRLPTSAGESATPRRAKPPRCGTRRGAPRRPRPPPAPCASGRRLHGFRNAGETREPFERSCRSGAGTPQNGFFVFRLIRHCPSDLVEVAPRRSRPTPVRARRSERANVCRPHPRLVDSEASRVTVETLSVVVAVGSPKLRKNFLTGRNGPEVNVHFASRTYRPGT